jgi:small GTP-binding protein
MGNLCICKRKIIKINLWGMHSGKTTILYKNILKQHDFNSIPTIGFDFETTKIGNKKVTFVDFGGGFAIYELRKHYLNEATDGIIYVIDSSRLDEDIYCQNELKLVMNLEVTKNIPVAIFFHKQDIIKEGKPTVEEIKKYYHFDEIPDINYKIFETSSITWQGIDEGINCLLNNIK